MIYHVIITDDDGGLNWWYQNMFNTCCCNMVREELWSTGYVEHQFQYTEFLYPNIHIWNDSLQCQFPMMWGFYQVTRLWRKKPSALISVIIKATWDSSLLILSCEAEVGFYHTLMVSTLIFSSSKLWAICFLSVFHHPIICTLVEIPTKCIKTTML